MAQGTRRCTVLDFISTHRLVPLMALAPLLIAVAVSDLRRLRIPNSYCLSAVALFAASAVAGLAPDYALRIAVAVSVLVLGFVAYCLKLFGGGDVKFMAALLLFVPVDSLQVYAFVFSAAMVAGIAAFLSLKRLPAAAALNWRSMAPGRQMPMGVPIALSGLLHPFAVMQLSGAF